MEHQYKLATAISVTTLFAGCSGAYEPDGHFSTTEEISAEELAEEEVAPVDSNPAFLTLTAEDGQVVSFHEAGSVIIVTETADAGQPFILAGAGFEGASALSVFEKLRPGEAVPAELLEAMERAATNSGAALADAAEADSVEPAVGGGLPAAQLETEADSRGAVGTIRQAFTAAEFLDDLDGCHRYLGEVFHMCYPNWANGFYGYAKAEHARFTVASQSGAFHARITAGSDGYGSGDYYIGDGKQRRFLALGAGCSWYEFCYYKARTLRIDIIHASGDRFHVGGSWFN